MEEQKKMGRPKVSEPEQVEQQLPKGWHVYTKMKLVVEKWVNNKPILKEVSEIGKCKLSDEQAELLNEHKYNTLIEYKK